MLEGVPAWFTNHTRIRIYEYWFKKRLLIDRMIEAISDVFQADQPTKAYQLDLCRGYGR
jgi:hypothetical protein